MLLEELVESARIEMQDLVPTAYVMSHDSIVRGAEKTINLMSRFMPKRSILEYDIVRTITSESLVIAGSTGTLAYKPVRDGTIAITGETEDTDYTINNLTGVVTEKDSGMVDATYSASYSLEPNMLDMDEIGLTEATLIRIETVEYPSQISPVDKVTFDVVGNMIILRGDKTFAAGNRVKVSYLEKWTPPTNAAAGNYPVHLDDIIIIGTVGQTLLFKAEKYTQESYTSIAASKTLLDAITAVTFTTAPDISSYISRLQIALSAANTLLDNIASITFTSAPDISSYQTAATGALDAGNTILDAISAVSFTSAPDISSIITASQTQLTAAEARYAFGVVKAALEDVIVVVTTGLAPVALAKMAAQTVIGAASLVTGATKFDIWTRGDRVGENYVASANASAALSQAYGNESFAQLELAKAHSNRAQVETNIGNGYVQSASQRLAGAARNLEKFQLQVAQDSAKVNHFSAETARGIAYAQEAAQRLAGASRDLEKFQLQVTQDGYKVGYFEAQVAQANSYIQEAAGHISTINSVLTKFQLEVQQESSKVTYYAAQLDKATKYETTAAQMLEVAGRYLASGQAKVNEFLVAMGIKPEFSSQRASSEQRT